MTHVIFINPDLNSDIYNLFEDTYGNIISIATDGGDPTIEQLKEKIDPLDPSLVYVVNGNYTTGLTTSVLEELSIYLTRLYESDEESIGLFYLSNFMDNCINRVELKTQPTENDEAEIKHYSMTSTTAPNGMAGLVTTRDKWMTILTLAESQKENNLSAKLSALVMNEKILAATSQPLFIYPDLMKQTEALDVLKTQYCRIEKNFGRAVPNTENLSLFWFVLGVSIVIFCTWILSYYTPDNKVLLLKKY